MITPRLLSAVLPVFLVSCSSVIYNRDFDPAFEATRYETFALLPIPHPETDQVAWDILGRDDFSLAVLRGAFESKGYRFVDEGSVDFFVGVRAATGRAGLPQGNASEGLGFSYSRLAKSMGDPFPGYEAPPDEKYDDSRSSEAWENQRVPGFYVIVEAFDADTRERVWSGWARAQTGFAYSNDEKRAAVLANLVRAFGN